MERMTTDSVLWREMRKNWMSSYQNMIQSRDEKNPMKHGVSSQSERAAVVFWMSVEHDRRGWYRSTAHPSLASRDVIIDMAPFSISVYIRPVEQTQISHWIPTRQTDRQMDGFRATTTIFFGYVPRQVPYFVLVWLPLPSSHWQSAYCRTQTRRRCGDPASNLPWISRTEGDTSVTNVVCGTQTCRLETEMGRERTSLLLLTRFPLSHTSVFLSVCRSVIWGVT